jgi:hypothetical protein
VKDTNLLDKYADYLREYKRRIKPIIKEAMPRARETIKLGAEQGIEPQ